MTAFSGFPTVTDHRVARLARAWLWLGVTALAGSGLLALLLVLSRTPGIQEVFPLKDFFRAALVVHVDLSVLIWFVAFAGVIWSVDSGYRFIMLAWAGFGLSAAGTAVMGISPFFPETEPLLNNYIPVLQQPVFFFGLTLVGIGFALTVLRRLVNGPGLGRGMDVAAALRFGSFLAALAGAAALLALALALGNAPAISGQTYYEMLFWGGGHALQFQHALLLVVAWWYLAADCRQAPALGPRPLALLLAIAALPVLGALFLALSSDAGSARSMTGFAHLMRMGHPLMLPLILAVVLVLPKNRTLASPAKSALWSSLALFAVGGILAYLIAGVNVVIPAHYHGSIVGITLAFMGMTYVVLPRLGFRPVTSPLARWQPYVYGGGQLIHVLGLAWSGGYGVQRKVAGAEQMLTTLPQKIGMGMMGLGGLIAIIGGVLFVWVCLEAMLGRGENRQPS